VRGGASSRLLPRTKCGGGGPRPKGVVEGGAEGAGPAVTPLRGAPSTPGFAGGPPPPELRSEGGKGVSPC